MNGDGGCGRLHSIGGVTAVVGWHGLRVGGCRALSQCIRHVSLVNSRNGYGHGDSTVHINTHASIAAGVGIAFSRVCLSVCLSTL